MSALKLSAAEVAALLAREFPQVDSLGLRIDALDDGGAVVALPTGDIHLRPGGTVSGPTLMMLADTAMYVAVLGRYGPLPLAVTTSLHIDFLRKPAPGEVRAECVLLKTGSRLAVGQVYLRTGGPASASASPAGGDDDLVAHATVTYSVPPTPSSTRLPASE